MDFYDIGMKYQNASEEELLNIYDKMDIDTVDSFNGKTLLHLAASLADVKAIQLLLDKGISANVKDNYGNFPLHDLAKLEGICGNRKAGTVTEDLVRNCADILLDAGASTIRKNENGDTVLTEAAKAGRYEIIEAAAAHESKLTITDRDGNNPLHVICDTAGHYVQFDRNAAVSQEEWLEHCGRAIRALVEAGVDTEEKNDYGQTPLDLLIESGAKSLTVILTGDDSSSVTGGMTVFEAILKNDLEALNEIIKNGYDFNAEADKGDFFGMTPLGVACYTMNIQAAELLLNAGADSNYKNSNGQTSMYSLIFYGEPYYGISNTALHYAVQNNTDSMAKEMAELLLEFGFQAVEAVNNNGETALEIASARDNEPLVKLLLMNS